MERKPFLPVSLFKQSLARDFRFGASKAFGFTIEPAMKRFINFDRKRLHGPSVIPAWQKCNTKLQAALGPSAFGQPPPGKPIIELVQDHSNNDDAADNDLTVVLFDAQDHDPTAN